MKLNKDNCTVYVCTQCGKIEYLPFAHHGYLSCDCKKSMPWKWICTREWVEEYRKHRVALGIDKE